MAIEWIGLVFDSWVSDSFGLCFDELQMNDGAGPTGILARYQPQFLLEHSASLALHARSLHSVDIRLSPTEPRDIVG